LNALCIFQTTTITKMNPTSVASTFSVQKISAHHFLIRGDNGVADYMKFCDTKWSNTYGGWIVREDEEVDLLQMHMEVLDNLKITRKELSKEKTKKANAVKRHTKDNKKDKKDTKKDKKESQYTRMKRGEDISDDEDEDDEYIPSTEPSSDEEEDEEEDEEDEDDDEEEDAESEDIEETSDDEEEEECETDKKRKKEYQFYKKEILAYGYMTEKQQDKLDTIWNKYLKGWLIPKSNLERLQKYGWTEVEEVEEVKPKKVVKEIVEKKVAVVHTPMVKKKILVQEEEKTFEGYKNMLLAKGKMTLVESSSIQAIFHPGMKAYLVFPEFKAGLVELGFKDITPTAKETVVEPKVVKISFTEGEKLEIKNID
jgi:hypothetical protein